ncbi:MORN repeat-containing protein [Hirschia maritima]|uniref:hypothetical protein n=1 Tax=Hirschia maritima TaxID=1121961 RepID=UPI0003729DC8|nr:hypothetical protein [Hirschia maritima]
MSTARPLTYMCDETDLELTNEFLTWMRRLEVRTEEIDESSLHFPPDLILLGKKSETFAIMDPSTAEGASYVVLDNDPPKHVATGVFRITTADMSGVTKEWSSLLHVIGRQIGMMSLTFRAQQIFEEGDDVLDMDLDFDQIEEGVRQEEYDRNSRFVQNFANNAGIEYKRLVEAQDYTDEAGQAFISARYSQRRANLAAERARTEMGRFFSHTKPDDRGVYLGRIVWDDDDFVTKICYEGETDGVDAHGFGVLTQTFKGVEQEYAGQFISGERAGFGVGRDQVLTWVGAWFADQPRGHGVLLSGKNLASQNQDQGEVFVSTESENYVFKKEHNKKLDGFRGYSRGQPIAKPLK